MLGLLRLIKANDSESARKVNLQTRSTQAAVPGHDFCCWKVVPSLAQSVERGHSFLYL